jgi:hypothetical protein
MKTSIFNGINNATLNYDYNIRYRPRVNVTNPLGMERQIKYLFEGINYERIYYVWENDQYSKHKHSHSMIKTNDENLISLIQKNLITKRDPILEISTKLIRIERYLTSTTTKIREYKPVEKYIDVEGLKIVGKHGDVFVEPILSVAASSIYINKYTDRGLTANFL